MSGPARNWLRLAVGEDQVIRLAAFREEHPEVIIGSLGFGQTWQARIPEENGETVITRHQLCDLLDELSALLGDR